MSFKQLQNNIKSKLDQLDQAGQDFFGGIEDSIEQTYENFEKFGEDLYDDAKKVFVGEEEDKPTVEDVSTVTGASKSDADRNGTKAKTKSAKPGPITKEPGKPPWPNELESYTSFSCIFTLGVLSPQEINSPNETYIKNGIKDKFKILRSGGGLNETKTTTAFEETGRVEYYMDDLDIDSFISPNNLTGISTGVAVSFSVYEPYSLGLFLQTLMIAAKKAGYKNYIEAPLLLVIEFRGWDENNNNYLAPNSTRKIPIKFTNVTVEADEGGSKYRCNAYVFNEMAFLDEKTTIKNDISIHGTTLEELLQKGKGSLSAVLNDDFVELENLGQKAAADRVIISFPKKNTSLNPSFSTNESDSASISYSQEEQESFEILNYDSDISQRIAAKAFSQVNRIGAQKVIEDWRTAGEVPYGIPGGPDGVYDSAKKIYDRRTKGLHPNFDSRTYRFTAGTKIEHIIEQMVLISDYGRGISNQLENPPPDGMINWFRIESEVYINPVEEQMRRDGTFPKIYVFKVVPYKTSASRFKSPNQKTPGILQRKENEAAKEYNYIYTGKNKDIIDFRLEYNYAFFTAINDDQENFSSTSTTKDQTKTGNIKKSVRVENPGPEEEPDEGAPETQGVKEANTQKAPGSEFESEETKVARDFHNAFMNSNVDLIKLDLTIMGDPYFIPNSGLGNYNANDVSGIDNIKEDASINYQKGEIDINIEFRTPFDYNQKGTVDYPKLEDTEIVNSFSGLYQVIKVRHSFQQNFFSQTLELVRRRHQDKTENESNIGPVTETTQFPDDFQQNFTF